MAASNLDLFSHLGDKMAAVSANKAPFLHVVIQFILKDRKRLLQVGQVINVLCRGIFP